MNMHVKCSVCVATAILAAGCSTNPSVKYQRATDANKSVGYEFVVPRTVVKVAIVPAEKAADGKPPISYQVSFTPAPTNKGTDKKTLQRYRVIDTSDGGWNATTTTITSVAYSSDLIIKSIGTKVTDNRKAAIDSIFALAGFAGVSLPKFTPQKSDKSDCPPLSATSFDAFVIGDPSTDVTDKEINACWTYSVRTAAPVDPENATSMDNLPLDSKVSWFPYPACQVSTITIKNRNGKESYQNDVPVSSGKYYRTMNLSLDGKVEMHADFCVADATSGVSPLSSDWNLLEQVIKGLKSLQEK